MNPAKDPIVLIDVGASGGLPDPWKKISKDLFVIGFEPDERSFAELESKKNSRFKYLNTGLYKERAVLDLYLTNIKTKSSLLRPNFKFIKKFPKDKRFEIVGQSKMKVDALDNQLTANGIKDADFMKIDIQGAELFGLMGAQNILSGSVFGVETEVEFAEVYEGQPLFGEVDSFLRKCGFQLFDLQPFYWKRKIGSALGGRKGQIIYANALYFKSHEYFSKNLDQKTGEEKKSKMAHFVSTALLYGYIDYALELCESFRDLFSAEEYKQLTDKINARAASFKKLPAFPGRGRLAKVFYKLWKSLRMENYKLKGDRLGNV